MSRISTLLDLFRRLEKISVRYGSSVVGQNFDEACKVEFSVRSGLEFRVYYGNLINEIREDIELIPNLSERHKNLYNSTLNQVAEIFSSKNMLIGWNGLREILGSDRVVVTLSAMEPVFEIERSSLRRPIEKESLGSEIENFRSSIEELMFPQGVKKMLLMHLNILRGLLDNADSFREFEIKTQYESFVAKFIAAYFDLDEVDRKKAKNNFESMIKRVREMVGLANETKELADSTGVTQVLTGIISSQ